MAERFEFELVSSDGSVVNSDNTNNTTDTSSPSPREIRAEENQQLRREAAERSKQRAIDRRDDRETRNRDRAERKEIQREKNIQREKDLAHRKRIAQERSFAAEQNRGQVLRRRFINNLFGAFNQAHLGRRINHGIDFAQSLSGGRERLGPVRDAVGVSRAAIPFAREFSKATSKFEKESRSETTNNNTNNTRDILKNTVRSLTKEQVQKRIERRSEFRSQFADPLKKRIPIVQDVTKLDPLVAKLNPNTKLVKSPPPVQAPPVLSRETIRRIASLGDGSARAARGALNGVQRFQRLVNRVGPKQAGRFVRGRAIRAFSSQVAKATGGLVRLGPVGLAAAAGVGLFAVGTAAAGAALLALNLTTRHLVRSIEGIPSPVQFAQIENQFKVLDARFRRADRLGGPLADIVSVQGDNEVKGFELFDNLIEPFLPVTEALNRIAGIVLDITNFFVKIDSKIGSLATLELIGETLNSILKLGELGYEKLFERIEEFVKNSAPWAHVLLKANGFFDDQKAAKEGELSAGGIMRNLFQAMNNPVGGVLAPFEIDTRVRDDAIPNVFEGI